MYVKISKSYSDLEELNDIIGSLNSLNITNNMKNYIKEKEYNKPMKGNNVDILI